MLYSVLCAIFWSTTGIFIKFINGIPVAQLLGYRFALALLFSLLLLKLWPTNTAPNKNRSPAWWAGMEISFLMTIYYACATTAFSLAPVSLVVLVIASTPVVTFLLQLYQTRHWNPGHIVGFAVTFTGIFIYIVAQGAKGNLRFNAATNIGIGCALGATLVRALYAVSVWRRAGQSAKVNALTMNWQTMLIGFLVCLPIMLLVPQESSLPNLNNIVFLLALASFATVLPTMLNTLAASTIDPTLHNIIGMSSPILAGSWAWLLLGEQQTLYSISAAVVVFLGILISLRPMSSVLPTPRH